MKTRHDNLVKLKKEDARAWEYANTRRGYWRISNSLIKDAPLTNEYLFKLELVSLTH